MLAFVSLLQPVSSLKEAAFCCGQDKYAVVQL